MDRRERPGIEDTEFVWLARESERDQSVLYISDGRTAITLVVEPHSSMVAQIRTRP